MDPEEALDVAIRHQAYIEGVKNHEADAMDETTEALVLLLLALLIKWGYPTVGLMPKRVLRDFTAEFNKRATSILDGFNTFFLKELKKIATIDALVTSLNFAHLTGKPAASPNILDSWTKINNDIIPGTGHLPAVMLKDFLTSTKTQMVLLTKRAYAEKWTAEQFATALNGTKAKLYKDGLAAKLKNQFTTVEQTLIQHIRQWFNYNIGRLFYSHYEWVSVLDSSTTDICRGRNGNIYEYGVGPRPPAHYNCRSTIVGITGASAFPVMPTSFYSWLSKQPVPVQNDLLGQSRAQQLRSGKLKAKDLPKFDGTRKITPDEYLNDQPKMIKEN